MSRPLSLSSFAWLPLVLAALIIIYLPGLDNLPVFDDVYLTDGELFAEFGAAADLRPRMLSYGSFVWLHELLGEGWWKQRLVNLGIHVAVVLALWGFYREILACIEAPRSEASIVPYQDSPALGFAIGFFALNPV